MNLTFRVLAALAALALALVLGWDPAPTARARATHHSVTHQHPSRIAIDDDDDYDDEDIVESGVLAPERHEIQSDTISREPALATTRLVTSVAVSSVHLSRRGILPSGEHRDATDRPPRA